MTVNIVLGIIGLLVIGGIVGWVIAVIRMAGDQSIVRLDKDEVIIKKPEDGFVFAQVTPEILRQLLSKNGGRDGGSDTEARTLMSRRAQP